MKKQVLLMVMMLLTVSGMAQAPNIEWAKCYGGNSGGDAAYVIQQTKDGGYIVAGCSTSSDGDVSGNHGPNYYDIWIVKLDSNSAIQWEKCFGGTELEFVTFIQQTKDDGYIVSGITQSNDGDVSGNHSWGNFDGWVLKLDSNGSLQWQKCLGGTDSDMLNSVQQTTDGGYIVAGNSKSLDGDATGHHGSFNYDDFWVVKLDSVGTVQWHKCIGGTYDDYATSIKQTNDGGYIAIGYTTSPADGDLTGVGFYHANDYWILKLDTVGIIKWMKFYGSSHTDRASSFCLTSDGGYIVVGKSLGNDLNVTGHHGGVDTTDIWVIKLNSIGNIQWQKSLGGTHEDFASSVMQTYDGGYIISGWSFSNNGDVKDLHGNGDTCDYWIVKLTNAGVIKWSKSLGGKGQDYGAYVQQTTDSGYIVAGSSASNDGDVIGNHGGWYDYWIVKLAKDPVLGIEEYPSSPITLFPNPTTGIITIKGIAQPSVAVYNLMGQKVVSAQGSNEVSLAQLPAGLYMVQVFSKDGELVKSEKVVKE